MNQVLESARGTARRSYDTTTPQQHSHLLHLSHIAHNTQFLSLEGSTNGDRFYGLCDEGVRQDVMCSTDYIVVVGEEGLLRDGPGLAGGAEVGTGSSALYASQHSVYNTGHQGCQI